MDQPSNQNIVKILVLNVRSWLAGLSLSRSEMLLSVLVGLSLLLMVYALASNYVFVGTRIVLTIGDEVELDREDLRIKHRVYSRMDSVGSLSYWSQFIEEVKNREIIRILGAEKFGDVSSDEIYQASVTELNLDDTEKSRSEIQLVIADILAEAGVSHSEFHHELAVNIYRTEFIDSLRSDIPDEGNVYRLDVIRDSSNRINLLVSEIQSGAQFAAAADRLGMQIVSPVNGDRYWLSTIEIKSYLDQDVADWVLSAGDSAISNSFVVDDTNEESIYRLSGIRVEKFDADLLSEWANVLFENMVADRRESLNINERFDADDRDWLVNETGLQLR
ncbi:MAG: hypothetical protein VYB76_05520 [Chloroflexota bacterium]|nr:hypothetical protein [Chloroflexota bacterium]